MKKLEQCSEVIVTYPKYVRYNGKDYRLNKYFNNDPNSLLYDLFDELGITTNYSIYVEPETLQVLMYKGVLGSDFGYASENSLT